MAYTGTVCTEAEIALFAGNGVGAGSTEANHNLLVAQAESFLSGLMGYNVVDNYAAMDADLKRVLSEWAARYSANSLILHNINGYTNQTEAQDLVNYNYARMKVLEELLSKQQVISFIKA